MSKRDEVIKADISQLLLEASQQFLLEEDGRSACLVSDARKEITRLREQLQQAERKIEKLLLEAAEWEQDISELEREKGEYARAAGELEKIAGILADEQDCERIVEHLRRIAREICPRGEEDEREK